MLSVLPSLKLTQKPLKIDSWKRRFLLETTIFSGKLLISGRVDANSFGWIFQAIFFFTGQDSYSNSILFIWDYWPPTVTTNWQRIEAMEDNLMTLLFDMGYTIEVQALGV